MKHIEGSKGKTHCGRLIRPNHSCDAREVPTSDIVPDGLPGDVCARCRRAWDANPFNRLIRARAEVKP